MDDASPEMPETWSRTIHPRRGGRYVPTVTIDDSAGERLAEWLEGESERVQAALAADGDPKLIERAHRYLNGEPDPVGAAIAALLASTGQRDKTWLVPDWVVDGWVTDHGLAFAACAATEVGELDITPTGIPSVRYQNGGRPRPSGDGCLRRARALLAVADDDVYKAAVEALEQHHRSSMQRLARAYLVPTRHDWVDDCCTDPGLADRFWYRDQWKLQCALDTPAHADLYRNHLPYHWNRYNVHEEGVVPTVIEGLGDAAVPLFVWLLENSDVEMAKVLYRGLAVLGTDAAFGVLAGHAGDKHVQPILIEAMERFPVRALRLLAPLATGTSATAATVTDLLRGHVRAHSDVVPDLPADVRKVVEPLLGAAVQSPDAPAEALPKVLVEPPWTVRGKPKPVIITGLEVPAHRSVVWEPGERDRWKETRTPWWRRPLEVHDWQEFASRIHSTQRNDVWRALVHGPEELLRPLVAEWPADKELLIYPESEVARAILGKYELDGLHLLKRALDKYKSAVGEFVLPFLSAETAEAATHWLAKVRRQRPVALAWFDRHGLTAVPFLLPTALGKRNAKQAEAESALRLLAATHGIDSIVEIAGAEHGERAAGAVRTMLATDPLDAVPARMPKIGGWADPERLPRVLLRDRGQALPSAAVGHLLSMLSICKPDQVYPGVQIVREACDPASLAEFSWEVFRHWDLHGAQSSDSWALAQLGWIGDDGTARRLAPLLRGWSADRRTPRVMAGLDVLAGIGSDVALAHLNGIAQSARSASLKRKARERLDQVAADRDLTREQLADRLAPDFGLDPDGGMTLDYGPRGFRVGFDEQLKPYVIDQDGKLLKVLPKPAKADDPHLAPAAHQRFAALKKDVAKVASDQVKRLERAMADQRRWNLADFRTFLVEHPLVWHIARRLVWSARVPGAELTFRLAEDRTFADADDAALTLPGDALITVAHPVHLGEHLATWSEVFADYEILQPFPQLGRTVRALTEEEAAAGRLARFEERDVPSGRLLGLRGGTWDAAQEHYGQVNELARPAGDGRLAVITISPGFDAMYGYGDSSELQTISRVELLDGESPARFGDLDPALASEILDDLHMLTAPTS